MSRLLMAIAGAVACMALFLGATSTDDASASIPIKSFKTTTTDSQAAAHPDLLLQFELQVPSEEPKHCDCNRAKDVVINMPPGFLGIPRNIPRCTFAEFALQECPVESQIGIVYLNFFSLFGENNGTFALYNMVPRDDQAALLAIETPVLGPKPIYTSFTVRTESDYGLESKTFGITTSVILKKVAYIFWGVPGDPIHDVLRAPPPPNGWVAGNGPQWVKHKQMFCYADATAFLLAHQYPEGACEGKGVITPYNAQVEAFLSNATSCTGPVQSQIDVLSYDLETESSFGEFPTATGCDKLRFDPTLSARPTTTEADSPSGLDIELTVPQSVGPNSPSPSRIKATTMTLPEGLTVNPNAANGKVSCSDDAANFGTRDAAECPEHSKIGSLTIESSSLPGLLHGATYLGQPLPGNRYRVFLVADGFSLHIKLAGVASPDPETGQLTVAFRDLPQAPFERFSLHIFGAERGLLATPEQCGVYPVKTTFTPWASELPNQTSTQFFTVDSGPGGTACPGTTRPFNPRFRAGSADSAGGAHSPFAVLLERSDGDQNLAGLTVSTPQGFSGNLKGIPYCSEKSIARLSGALYSGIAELTTPLCPASQIGDVTAGSGAGSRPILTSGRAYLAGPYKGAPLSLVVVVPAVSGPYDLGNVVVRAAIQVDPVTARVTTVSDPLPQIIEGIRLRSRSILVNLNRPNFALNPTNCRAMTTDVTVAGGEGSLAARSTHYQVSNCTKLSFAPNLRLRLRGSSKRRGHPAVRAVLTKQPGEANLRRVVTTMPESLLLDNSHIGTVCTRVQFAAESCPARSVIGSATVETPILDQPLRGPVVLRSSSNQLPDLAVDLEGQIAIELSAKIDTVKGGGLRTTFTSIPDAPITRTVLNLRGGARGLLINSQDLCKGSPRAAVTMKGQNGAKVRRKISVNPTCRRAKAAKRSTNHHRGRTVR